MDPISLQQRPRVFARMAQCPFRRERGCGAIDIAAGWAEDGGCSITIDECDACYESGRGVGAASVRWRANYIATLVSNVKKAIGSARAPVIVAIIRKHCTHEEAAGVLRDGAKVLGRQRAMEMAERIGNTAEIAAIFDAMNPQEAADALDPADAWAPHAKRWAEIEAEIAAGDWQPVRVSLPRAVWSFVMALWSSRGGRKGVDLATLDTRTISCLGIDLKGKRHKAACPSVRRTKKGWHYCGHCRCGDKKAARLDGEGFTKLMHPQLTCPRQMPGFAVLTVAGKEVDAPRSLKKSAGQSKAGVAGSPEGPGGVVPLLRVHDAGVLGEEGVQHVAVPDTQPDQAQARAVRAGHEPVP